MLAKQHDGAIRDGELWGAHSSLKGLTFRASSIAESSPVPDTPRRDLSYLFQALLLLGPVLDLVRYPVQGLRFLTGVVTRPPRVQTHSQAGPPPLLQRATLHRMPREADTTLLFGGRGSKPPVPESYGLRVVMSGGAALTGEAECTAVLGT